ncbi:SDR family oxidoreductase [Aeromicrobium sp. NPDC092404]|uniref:SDR family NAD(P)-dependent oxidoreductase n=1 Tax=Aeromicrobium sp. NPDC092404 TaxID=3154976 RepID=UPI003417B705
MSEHVALITGAAGGIGSATAARFLEAGTSVVGFDLKVPDHTARTMDAAAARGGGEIIWIEGSVTDLGAMAAARDLAVKRFGGVDVWVNNAARLFVGPFLETTDADWLSVLDSNLLGYVRGARLAAEVMVPRGRGSIINVGSVVEVLPPTEMSVYVTAKAGVTGLTRALAVELGPRGVRVNCVSPGATETPLNEESWTDAVRDTYKARIPLRAIATSDDVAGVIAMVASSDASYMTGQVVVVDGGLSLDGSVGHRGTGGHADKVADREPDGSGTTGA